LCGAFARSVKRIHFFISVWTRTAGDLLLSVEFGKLGVAKSKGANNEQGRTGSPESRA
jgi:hypothetical protein